MRQLLYILLAITVFTSCDHEMDNWPDVDTGAAVPQITLAEGSNYFIDFDKISETKVLFDLSYISKSKVAEMNVQLIYDNGSTKKSYNYGKITSFPTIIDISEEKLNDVTKGEFKNGTILPGHHITLNISELILTDGTKINPTSEYKIKVADKEKDLNVKNYSNKITNSVFYKLTSDLYVASSTLSNIYSGEYSVTVDGEKALEDTKVTWEADDHNISCSHLVGGIWSNYGIIASKLFDCGEGYGLKFISTTASVWAQIPVTRLDVAVTKNTQIITVNYADAWGNTSEIIFTPKK